MLVPGEEPLPSQGAGRDPPCLSEEVAEPLEKKDGLQEVEREGVLRSSLDGTETVQDNSFLQQLQPQQCGPITAKFGSFTQHRGRERDTPGRDSGKGYTGALEEALSKMNISCRFLQETVETLLSKCETLMEERQSSVRERTSLQKRIDSLSADLEKTRKAELEWRARVAETEGQAAELRRSFNARLDELHGELQELRGEVMETEGRNLALLAEKRLAEERLEAVTARESQWKDELRALKTLHTETGQQNLMSKGMNEFRGRLCNSCGTCCVEELTLLKAQKESQQLAHSREMAALYARCESLESEKHQSRLNDVVMGRGRGKEGSQSASTVALPSQWHPSSYLKPDGGPHSFLQSTPQSGKALKDRETISAGMAARVQVKEGEQQPPSPPFVSPVRRRLSGPGSPFRSSNGRLHPPFTGTEAREHLSGSLEGASRSLAGGVQFSAPSPEKLSHSPYSKTHTSAEADRHPFHPTRLNLSSNSHPRAAIPTEDAREGATSHQTGREEGVLDGYTDSAGLPQSASLPFSFQQKTEKKRGVQEDERGDRQQRMSNGGFPSPQQKGMRASNGTSGALLVGALPSEKEARGGQGGESFSVCESEYERAGGVLETQQVSPRDDLPDGMGEGGGALETAREMEMESGVMGREALDEVDADLQCSMESGGGVSKWKGVPIPILASPGKRQKVRSSEKKRESSLSPQPAVYRREGRENGVGVNCAESVSNPLKSSRDARALADEVLSELEERIRASVPLASIT